MSEPQIHQVDALPENIRWEDVRMLMFDEKRLQIYDGVEVIVYEFPSRKKLEQALEAMTRKRQKAANV